MTAQSERFPFPCPVLYGFILALCSPGWLFCPGDVRVSTVTVYKQTELN